MYIAKTGKTEHYYFTDERVSQKQKDKLLGLGALSQTQAKNSMFGDNQRMDILNATSESLHFLESLMGKEVQPRTDFIFKNVDFSQIKE